MRLRPDRRVFDDAAPTLLIAGPDADPDALAALQAAGIDTAQGCDVRGVLSVLYERGVRSVLVEGGAHVIGAFVRAGLADELVVHLAPVLLGCGGLPLLSGDGITTLATAPRFALRTVERSADDTLLTLEPRAATEEP